MQGQRMADFIASNVSSTVALWEEAHNSYPSKAVIFPDRWSQQHRCYTGIWACLCQWSLAWVWESTGQNISSFCLESPSSNLQKDPDWLADPFRPPGGKLEPSHEEKGSTFLLPLPLERALVHFQSPQSPSGHSFHSATAIIQHDRHVSNSEDWALQQQWYRLAT